MDGRRYHPLDKTRSPLTLENFKTTVLGRFITHIMVSPPPPSTLNPEPHTLDPLP